MLCLPRAGVSRIIFISKHIPIYQIYMIIVYLYVTCYHGYYYHIVYLQIYKTGAIIVFHFCFYASAKCSCSSVRLSATFSIITSFRITGMQIKRHIQANHD